MTLSENEDASGTLNMSLKSNYSQSEQHFFSSLAGYWEHSEGTVAEKLSTFARFAPRQAVATFLAREQIFRHVLKVHGHIVECGVFRGGGFFSWSHFSAILEPYNHIRRVVGFDTFEGFPALAHDDGGGEVPYKHVGGLAAGSEQEIREGIGLHDLNRPLGHLSRNELVVGDATKTIPQYIVVNKHLVVALLYLDFDLYDPTKTAIESFWPRMPKGAVIAFDELNQKQWPGETMALMDTIGIGSLHIQRLEFNPQICFAIKE